MHSFKMFACHNAATYLCILNMWIYWICVRCLSKWLSNFLLLWSHVKIIKWYACSNRDRLLFWVEEALEDSSVVHRHAFLHFHWPLFLLCDLYSYRIREEKEKKSIPLEHVSKVEQYIIACIHIAHIHNISLLTHRERDEHSIYFVKQFVFLNY